MREQIARVVCERSPIFNNRWDDLDEVAKAILLNTADAILAIRPAPGVGAELVERLAKFEAERAESAERERDDYKHRLDEAKALAVDAGAAAIGLRAKLNEAVKMLERIGKGSSGYSLEARATLTRIKGDEA